MIILNLLIVKTSLKYRVMVKFTFLVLFISTVSGVHAQQSTDVRPSDSKTINPSGLQGEVVNYFETYGLDEVAFKACFKNAYVPTNFPIIQQFDSMEAYKGAVGIYIQQNPHLFVVSEVAKYGYFVAESAMPTEEDLRRARGSETMSESDRLLHEQKQSNTNGQ